jgi:hypothetical protein
VFAFFEKEKLGHFVQKNYEKQIGFGIVYWMMYLLSG